MFDIDLFYALCEKYNVELSNSAKEPMIKDKNGVHAVTGEDVSRIFAPSQTILGYYGQKIDAAIITKAYYLQEDYAIAC